MKLHQLLYFAATAEQGSVRSAAQALGISAAAVSRAIIELEDEVKTPLIERQSQGTSLTEAGRTLLMHAKLMRSQMEKAEDEMRAVREGRTTRLTIGVTPWFSLSLMPMVVTEFLRLRQDVKIEIQEILGTGYASLRDGTLDLAIGLGPRQPLPDLDVVPLFSYASTIVCRNDHPLAQARTIAELQGQSWTLSRDAYEFESPYDELFGLSLPGKAAPRVHVIRSALLSMTMVEMTDMLSVTPWPLLESPWLRGRIQPINLAVPLADRQTALITRRNNLPTPTSRQFIDCLVRTIGRARQAEDGVLKRIFRTIDLHDNLDRMIQDRA
ncbi:LysR family transcriptional regulator [Comamonadaceae bacterium PP-2]